MGWPYNLSALGMVKGIGSGQWVTIWSSLHQPSPYPMECGCAWSGMKHVLHCSNMLKEIIDVPFGGLQLVLMKCSWILVNTCDNATMKWDEYGFLMVNHGWRVSTHVEPYMFPSIVFLVSFWFPQILVKWKTNTICINQSNV